MPQRAIGVSEESFQKFKLVQERLERMGSFCSASMTLEYLAAFYFTVADGYGGMLDLKTAPEQFRELQSVVRSAINDRPQKRKRREARPSQSASVEKRLEVTQMIQERLKIPNPPRVLVDYYLDQGAHTIVKLREAEDGMHSTDEIPMPSDPQDDAPKIARLS